MRFAEMFQRKMRESEAREDAIRKNPALANTPEMIALYRKQGVFILMLGMAVFIADAVSWEVVGSVFVYFVVVPILLFPLGIYMMATGKNPLRNFRRH